MTNHNIFIIYDDREFTSTDIQPFVGDRHYSDIIFRRYRLLDYLLEKLPNWTEQQFFHLQKRHDVRELRDTIERFDEGMPLLIISSRAGLVTNSELSSLLERLPFAEDSFTDRLFKPLLVFYRSSNTLLEQWDEFMEKPLNQWDTPWKDMQRLTSVKPLDLGKSKEFLLFMSGSTETRHFNEVSMDTYYYCKRSSDKQKMQAEYQFYSLVPESMRPWLIQPFDFESDDTGASYKMLRYYLADTAIQWVHGAFTDSSFREFIERLFFFVAERPRKKCDKKIISAIAQQLFVDKVQQRIEQLLALPAGQKINNLLSATDSALDINTQFARYKTLYDKYASAFHQGDLRVGHGDPCFSNILYDQQRNILKLIDPKGAIEEAAIWTHPLYDLAKISHSVLGNYDFINNGQFDCHFNDNTGLELRIHSQQHQPWQNDFRQHLKQQGYDWRVVRLAEASLFLSMLPLHIDHPKKVMAFIMIAQQILTEVERGKP